MFGGLRDRGRRPRRIPCKVVAPSVASRAPGVADLTSGRRHYEPLAEEALSLGLAGSSVGHYLVQRMSVVDKLPGVVRAPCRRQLRCLDPDAGTRCVRDERRRPHSRTRRRARALAILIVTEQIQRVPPSVDKDASQRRASDADIRP